MSEGIIKQINIEKEMQEAYIDYSMSVIVSRALPDVRDGLKPVHRRILYDMSHELHLYSSNPTRKSARIVGDVLGKFHPHGDSSVYDAMCRMAQWWSLRYPLVDGQGNFGSMDGDSPAAMRYTEARMKKITDEVMADIEKDTVDFVGNFDETEKEPTVLPTRIPLLIVNGASGIAVGMATNMAPHNLGEVCDAICAYIDKRDISVDELSHFIKGPDFPTGGIIYGYSGVREALETGRGRIVVRARTEIETTPSGRESIIVTEIPYMVNKADMIQRIANMINEKKLDGISYINDESSKDGIRVVIILKQGVSANVMLNTLYRETPLQTTFSVNNIALEDGKPVQLSMLDLIKDFVAHRHEIVVRRTRFDLKAAEARAHIINGLLIALDNIDEIISIIRNSETPDKAKAALSERFGLDDIQASAIIEMRLRQLTGLERGKLEEEYAELCQRIDRFRAILADENLQLAVVKEETLEIKEKYADERRTEIQFDAREFNPWDFYKDEPMVITVTHQGYIKRTPLTEYRSQGRGGKGMRGAATKDEDYLEYVLMASMHSVIFFFTEQGRCYWQNVYDIPEGTRSSKGRAIQNILPLTEDNRIRAYITVHGSLMGDQEYLNSHYIMMCSRQGIIKKTCLEEYSRPRSNGIIALGIREGDELLDARITSGSADIMLGMSSGLSVHFHESSVRPMGRGAAGVKGVTLSEGDSVVSLSVFEEGDGRNVLALSEKGFGKRTDLDQYRLTNRGGKGVKTINVTEKTGSLVALKDVDDTMDLMIITAAGTVIRTPVGVIRNSGRATQGVKMIDIREGDSIASVTLVPSQTEDEGGTSEEAAGAGSAELQDAVAAEVMKEESVTDFDN